MVQCTCLAVLFSILALVSAISIDNVTSRLPDQSFTSHCFLEIYLLYTFLPTCPPPITGRPQFSTSIILAVRIFISLTVD